MDTNTWKWFYLDQLFSIDTGKDLIYSELSPGEYPVIGHKAENNGVTTTTQYLTTHKLYDYTKTISLADRGNFYASVQTHDFYVGTRVKALVAKFEAKIESLLYICVLINKEQYRFSYGRNCCDRISEFKIKLPVTPEGTPDWKYMDDFVKDQIIPQLPKKAQKVWLKKYDTKPLNLQSFVLNTENWKHFYVEDLFKLEPTKGTTTDELSEGYDIPYIAAKHDNNGCDMMCSRENNEQFISKGNCIVFINLGAGSAGYALYQGGDFIGMSGKTTCGYNPNLNKYNGLFVATILSKERPKYSFGRSWSGERLKKTKIKLPVTPSGEPDWQFMEDYIKSLPYSKNIEPSDPNEIVDELMEVKRRVIEMQKQLAAQQPGSITNYGTVNIYEK